MIIRVRSGQRSAMRRTLESHGDQIVAEHASIDALTAVVHGDDLAALAGRDGVVSVSTDAVVRARGGLLGGLLGVVGGLVGGVVNTLGVVVGGVVGIVGGPADEHRRTGRAAAACCARRSASSSALAGRGVGVAVIDSGLEMSSDFQGRVLAFYDFTGGKTLPTYAVRRLRPRHARRRHHRRVRRATRTTVSTAAWRRT